MKNLNLIKNSEWFKNDEAIPKNLVSAEDGCEKFIDREECLSNIISYDEFLMDFMEKCFFKFILCLKYQMHHKSTSKFTNSIDFLRRKTSKLHITNSKEVIEDNHHEESMIKYHYRPNIKYQKNYYLLLLKRLEKHFAQHHNQKIVERLTDLEYTGTFITNIGRMIKTMMKYDTTKLLEKSLKKQRSFLSISYFHHGKSKRKQTKRLHHSPKTALRTILLDNDLNNERNSHRQLYDDNKENDDDSESFDDSDDEDYHKQIRKNPPSTSSLPTHLPNKGLTRKQKNGKRRLIRKIMKNHSLPKPFDERNIRRTMNESLLFCDPVHLFTNEVVSFNDLIDSEKFFIRSERPLDMNLLNILKKFNWKRSQIQQKVIDDLTPDIRSHMFWRNNQLLKSLGTILLPNFSEETTMLEEWMEWRKKINNILIQQYFSFYNKSVEEFDSIAIKINTSDMSTSTSLGKAEKITVEEKEEEVEHDTSNFCLENNRSIQTSFTLLHEWVNNSKSELSLGEYVQYGIPRLKIKAELVSQTNSIYSPSSRSYRLKHCSEMYRQQMQKYLYDDSFDQSTSLNSQLQYVSTFF
ncbi:hypothetical protein SNEBB_003243 [Seison nebaliae]|nr:hypothetical protein SNEBB_003243 [Seison nebaliae]